MPQTLRLLNRGPLPDTLKVFESYSPTGVFRLAHKRLADAVVGIFTGPRFVVDHRSVLAERRLLGLVPLEGLADFGNAAHRHLSRQPEPLPPIMVDELLQPVLASRAIFKRYARYPVHRLVEAFKRLKQDAVLYSSEGESLTMTTSFMPLFIPQSIDKRHLRDYGGLFVDYRWRGSNSSSPVSGEASSEQTW